ncbi:MAG: hypothetical protein WB783_12005 [Arenicellales bacterium]
MSDIRDDQRVEEKIERLRGRENAARERLEQMEQAGERAREQLEGSVEEAVKHLDEALKSTRSKLKQQPPEIRFGPCPVQC